MNSIAAHKDVGSSRAAAAMCGTTPKRVKRAVPSRRSPRLSSSASAGIKRIDDVRDVVAERIERPTAVGLLDQLLHPSVVILTDGGSSASVGAAKEEVNPRRERPDRSARGGDFYLAEPGTSTRPLTFPAEGPQMTWVADD
jgi:hypothetical protein